MVRKRLKIGIQIGIHEKKLFSYLYENRVATSEQIYRDIYPNYSRRSVQNRLSKLINGSFIKRNVYQGLGNTLIYSLGDKGFKLFVRPLGVNVKREFGSHAVSHDLDLLEIRRMLRRLSSVIRYYPENLIATESSMLAENLFIESLRPDAVVEVQLKGKTFCLALEYEAACKYASRYKELFQKYYANKAVSGVLYICKSETLLNHIRNIEKNEIGEEIPKFYYSDFSKWNDAGHKLFINLRGSCITL